MKRLKNVHKHLEQALHSHIGEVLSTKELEDILVSVFPGFKSVMPTDHIEPSDKHKNQCKKCANPDYQLLDEVIDGIGLMPRTISSPALLMAGPRSSARPNVFAE